MVLTEHDLRKLACLLVTVELHSHICDALCLALSLQADNKMRTETMCKMTALKPETLLLAREAVSQNRILLDNVLPVCKTWW